MHLLLFSGLGDRDWLLWFAAKLWRLRGYQPVVWKLRWNRNTPEAVSFVARLQVILHALDTLPKGEQVYIIGNSAGGVVTALVALLRPERVKRAIAVASPLTCPKMSRNSLLDEALARLQQELVVNNPNRRGHIASFYGLYDPVVRPRYSRLEGVHQEELPVSGHPRIIFAAHTIFSGRLSAWLRGV